MTAATSRIRRLMSCLGEPSRFELVRLLARGERCVTDLAAEVGLSQSCTTRHLQALRREGLAEGRRDGKRVLFRLLAEEPHVADLIAWAISARARPGALGGPRPTRDRSASSRRQALARQTTTDSAPPPPSAPSATPATPATSPVREAVVVAATPRRPRPGGEIEEYLL